MIKNSIRCCISCILPCGALDVIRIVHCNGRVEEISGTIKASDIMKAHPQHVLKKPSNSSSSSTTYHALPVPKILIVPPDAELQRGKIYFLTPLPPQTQDNNIQRKKKKTRMNKVEPGERRSNNNSSISVTTRLVVSDDYLNDILSENKLSNRRRSSGRVAVWRPHLESISESPSHNHLY